MIIYDTALTFLCSESVFGYITVLPGAFSAYRYIALQNDPTGEGPLQKYFLGEKFVRLFEYCVKQHTNIDVAWCWRGYLHGKHVSRGRPSEYDMRGFVP